MSKYEVIKRIMESEKINENEKVYFIHQFLLHWETEETLEWIWE